MKPLHVITSERFTASFDNCRLPRLMAEEAIHHLSRLPGDGSLVRKLFNGIADDGACIMFWRLKPHGFEPIKVWYAWYPVERCVIALTADHYDTFISEEELERTVADLQEAKLLLTEKI